MKKKDSHLLKDFSIILLSIIVAWILIENGAIESFLTSTQQHKILGSFVAGFFFAFAFTTAPAIAVIGEIAQANSIYLIALTGAFGALFGDLIVFFFLKDRLGEDFYYLLKKTRIKRFFSIFRLKHFRWLTPVVGGLLIASPLPDEIGISIMGLAKIKTAPFMLVSLFFNFLGILVIAIVANNI